MTEVIRRSKNKSDDNPTTDDETSSNGNSNGIFHTNNNNNNNNKRKSRSTLTSHYYRNTIQYIITLIVLLSVITILHQWEHPTTTTTPTTNHKSSSNKNQKTVSDTSEHNSIPQRQQTIAEKKAKNRTIAYVVTITSCNGHERDNTFQIIEGASVLRHSIHMNSIHNPDGRSVYDYQLYAFYHPDAILCATALLDFGYIIISRPTPVRVQDIQNPLLQERIVKNGCCGEKELIKFEAFTLTSYPLVVLLDIDTLIVQPLDRLFHFMFDVTQLPDEDDLLYYPNKPALAGRNTNVTIPTQSSSSSSQSRSTNTGIDLLYTTDYAMVHPDRYIKPVQGGFVILRPNQTVYNDFVNIVQVGDFQFDGNTDLGWGGRTGRFWGAMTFQGLMPYYFQILYPDRALELNWCRYNNMCSPSYDTKKNDPTYKLCMTQQENCEDCRLRSIQNISLIHFTVCQKPWLCQLHSGKSDEEKLCQVFHREWFKVRSMMEQSWGRSGAGPAKNYHNDQFFGYCKSYGQHGYIPLQKPYGLPLTSTS